MVAGHSPFTIHQFTIHQFTIHQFTIHQFTIHHFQPFAMSNLLEVRDIHTYIGQFHILEGVSLQVPAGEIVALLGRNGAGKTTTLKSILGLIPPRSGQVIFDGQEIQGRRSFEIASLGIGFVPEHRAIFRDLSVQENLKIAERKKGDLERKADFIFELFPDLRRLIKLPGTHLSGGQQQMLAVARAMVPDNRLLLIDEPSEGLAPVIIEAMMGAIRKLSATTTVVLVEQNFIVASQLARHYVIVEEGRSVQSGAMADLVQDKATIQRYLGAA
jgi:branched-chain amino acid transport system ATP-binding protein